MRVSGKVAVVTGASRGVGLATAKRLQAEGASVIITDIHAERGAASAEQLGVEFVQQDVSSAEGWQSLARSLHERHGRLDILVNNAAILHAGSVIEESVEGWHQMMAVNAGSVFLAIKTLLPLMAEQDGGSIINLSSSSALMGMPQFCAYTAAKAAVRSLTMSTAVLCKQQGRGVRCNSIHPDGINTDMVREIAASLPAGDKQQYQRTAPFICQPEDIANTILFLASDESKHINGAAIAIDNTATIHPPYL